MNLIMKLGKFVFRSIEYAQQICKDFHWHRRFDSADLPSMRVRVLEQARLLIVSGIDGEDYYNHGLFRPEMPFSKKREFLGYYKKYRYYDTINPPQFDILARDKILFHMLAKSLDIPVPELLAVTMAKQEPVYGRCLYDRLSLETFLLEETSQDMFLKPGGGSFGDGALGLGKKVAGAGWRKLPGNDVISMEEVIEHIIHQGEMSRFLIQKRLKPHCILDQIVPDVCSTVRVMTYVKGREVSIVGAALRLGNGNEPTDNLSGGGCVASIALDTGRLGPLVSIDSGVPQRLSAHPKSGEVVSGKYIEGWGPLLDLVKASALKLSFIPSIGWDVAVTENGPIIVEINTHPRCRPIQVANDAGILVGMFREALSEHDGIVQSGLTLRSSR